MYTTLREFLNENNNSYDNLLNTNSFNNYFFDSFGIVDNRSITAYANSLNSVPNTLLESTDCSLSEIKFKHTFLNISDKVESSNSYDSFFYKYPDIQTSHLTKLYMPKPFVASPLNIYNGLP